MFVTFCYIGRLHLSWNLLKVYPGKSSGSQVWKLQPCEQGKAHQDLRDDKFHHLHVAPSSDTDAWTCEKVLRRPGADRKKFSSRSSALWGKTSVDAAMAYRRGRSGKDKVSCWWCWWRCWWLRLLRPYALCAHRVLKAVRQVWLRLDLSCDWSPRFRWSSREVSGIIGKMSDRHKIGWWNIIRKPFVIRGEPGSLRGVVSLKWSHPSPQLHIWLGHE